MYCSALETTDVSTHEVFSKQFKTNPCTSVCRVALSSRTKKFYIFDKILPTNIQIGKTALLVVPNKRDCY